MAKRGKDSSIEVKMSVSADIPSAEKAADDLSAAAEKRMKSRAGGVGKAMPGDTFQRLLPQNIEERFLRTQNAERYRAQEAQMTDGGRAMFAQRGGVLTDARAQREAAEVRRFVERESAQRLRDDAAFAGFVSERRAHRSSGYTGSKDGPSLDDMRDATVDARQKREGLEKNVGTVGIGMLSAFARALAPVGIAMAASNVAGAANSYGLNYMQARGRISDATGGGVGGGRIEDMAGKSAAIDFQKSLVNSVPILGEFLGNLTGVNAALDKQKYVLESSVNAIGSAARGGSAARATFADLMGDPVAGLAERNLQMLTEEGNKLNQLRKIARENPSDRDAQDAASDATVTQNQRRKTAALSEVIAKEQFDAHISGIAGQRGVQIQEQAGSTARVAGNAQAAFQSESRAAAMALGISQQQRLAGKRGKELEYTQSLVDAETKTFEQTQRERARMFTASLPEGKAVSGFEALAQGQYGAAKQGQESELMKIVDGIAQLVGLFRGDQGLK